MKDDSVSAMADGALATIWSAAACWAGFTWAYAITTRQWPWDFSWMEWLWRRALARSRPGGGGAGGVGEPAEEAVAVGGELRR